MNVKKVAILGAGNGGLTAAADLAERGFEISLYTWPTREYQFEGLINRGGLLLQEPNAEPPKEVFIPITNYTIDMEEAIRDAQVIQATRSKITLKCWRRSLVKIRSSSSTQQQR